MSDSSSTGPDAGGDQVDDATRAEEDVEAKAAHVADRAPTAEEEAEAEKNKLDPDVAAHERDMDKIGAEVQGEGQID
ncbi:MAG TPA: hypothetical protein VHS57_10110 [Acidimicrobiales bacterium]|nr:hypothetical protein [Acidimicrobiales bacterium]